MIPVPIKLSVSGNKCGGCCRSVTIKKEPSINYVVFYADSKNGFVCGKPEEIPKLKRIDSIQDIIQNFQRSLFEKYNVSWQDIPEALRKLSVDKRPSVEDLTRMDSAVQGFVEGVKQAKRLSNESLNNRSHSE